jgi:hypothetical protein
MWFTIRKYQLHKGHQVCFQERTYREVWVVWEDQEARVRENTFWEVQVVQEGNKVLVQERTYREVQVFWECHEV